MSRYSFIDDNINLTGKQCFCIDVNSSNSPFIIGGMSFQDGMRPNIAERPQSPRSVRPQSPTSVRPQSPTSVRPQSPRSVRPQSPRSVRPQSPIKNISLAPSPVAGGILGYENKKSDHQTLTSDYLLTPNVINSNPREQEIIKTVNTMLTQVYSNVQKEILGSNAAEIDIPKNSLTQMPSDDTKTKSKIDLNKMANDKQVGKKTVRKSSSNLNLFEGFQQSGCSDVCKPKKYSRVKSSSKTKSKFGSNENIYLLVIIVLFLLVSWFKK